MSGRNRVNGPSPSGTDSGKLSGVFAYVLAFLVAYAIVGSFDNAFDARTLGDSLEKHNVERLLSATFSIAGVLGASLIWLWRIESWIGGLLAGVVVALAAGGVHVLSHALPLAIPALALGAACGVAFFAVGKKGFLASALLAALAALALVQLGFLGFYY